MSKKKKWQPKSKRRKPIKRSIGVGRKTKESLERQAKLEIDLIFAEYKEELEALRGTGESGVLYARHSSEHQDSIPAQIRSLILDAIAKKIFISREHVFYDIAVRGSKQHRKGLDAATAVIRDTETKILLVFKTNRLYRKMYRALEYVERLIKTWNARIIFTRDNLDSASDDYEDIKLQLLAMLDEHGRRAHVDNIQSKHLDMFSRMIVHGTITFGYYGEIIEGELTKRNRPRRRFAIDEFEAEFVLQIFSWFVEDGMSIAEIVQTLNDMPEAPLPPRAECEWTRLAVLTLLKNTRYIGVFKYGEKETKDQPDIDYILRRDRDEPLGVVMVEDLRIVPDALFFDAQELIKENKSRGGRKPNPTSKPTGSEIIRGVFECAEHKCALWVSGGSIYCKKCDRRPREARYLHSRLKTSVAVQQLLTAIGNVLSNDEVLLKDSYEHTILSVTKFDSPDPDEIKQLNDRNSKLGSRIKFAKENVGESTSEQEETKLLIAQLRNERTKVESRLRDIENASKASTEVPDFPTWAKSVKSLGKELLACRDNFDSMRLSRVRRLIQFLVGGRIPLIQCGENVPRGGWHRASFTIALGTTFDASRSTSSDQQPGRIVEIEFKNTDESRLISESDEAYVLDTIQKLPRNEIGKIKGWSKSKVTRLLKYAYARRGEDFVDGRGRRCMTAGREPVFKQIADDVIKRFGNGSSLNEIAEALAYSVDTVRSAFKYWHESRDLPIPESHKKIKRHQDIQRAFYLDFIERLPRSEIARILKCSPAKLTGLLKEGYSHRGEEFVDRRGQSRDTERSFKFKEISKVVGDMVESGYSFTKVAKQLGVDRTTVSKAHAWYKNGYQDVA